MSYKKLFISLGLPLGAGILGSFFTASAISGWYAGLQKPWFSPPNWLFGPVWTTLYIMMGVAVYLVWQKADKDKAVKFALRLFWIHLFWNAIWSPVFFGLKSPALGLAVIIIIWVLILALIIRFRKISRLSAYLLIPYFLWVSFASVLNFFLWRGN